MSRRVLECVSQDDGTGTHGLKLYVTTMTMTHVCPMCDTVFPNLGQRANPCVVTSFLKRKVFYESIRSIVRMGGRGGDNSFSRVLTRSASLFFLNEVGLLRRHIKYVFVWRT